MATMIRFWMDSWKDPKKSAEAGRPVYDTVAWFEKRVPGDHDSVTGPVHRHPKLKNEFRAAWEAFERDQSCEGVVGTHLKMVPWLERGDVENLVHSGIKTLEALASVNDANVSSIPGGLKLRQKARDMLKASEASAPLQAMAEELGKLRDENKEMKSQLAEFLSESKRRKAKE